ncbi:RHS repeat-associated core domain-containing protein [Bradyrhizobium oligotrophicum]|uniref:RHS repeat-associated core domain-containing protein n=1 Tax=Bradyrhizobium oligotrophicum TaxID=44255 RepID=UPI003EC143CA
MRNAIKSRVVCAALASMLASSPSWAASTVTQATSFAYDAATGMLIQQVVEPDTPAFRLQTDYARDSFGNVLTTTVSGVDIVTSSSAGSYDSRGQFATSNSNALGQTESVQYDARSGQPTSQTGPNGLTTSWSYDGFGRKTQEIRPDGTQTKWAYLICSGVNGGTATCPSGAAYQIQETPYAAGGTTVNGPYVIVYYDMLDREIARDSQGFDGSTIRAATSYDALGRVTQTSRPYFVNGGTPRYTSFTYDVLGRALTKTKPDGSVSQVAYHGLSVTKTNALGQTRSVRRNSQGNIVSVTDALGQTMTYVYDAAGNLVRTTDPVGNVVTASYDVRGNKVASSDPDLGTWSYAYNTLGLLVSQTDAKGQTVTMSYDKLDRMVQSVEPDMTSVWVYDTAAHGIGKLASTAITAGPGNGYAKTASYDALGRPAQVATTIDGATYTMAASYDANGLLSAVSYPSGFTARYGRTSLGDANQLLDNATGQAFWTADTLDAELRITQDTVGNGLTTTRSFDALTGRLTGISTGSGGSVQNFSYSYDRRGNPLSRSDANTNLSETFTYDVLSRLTSSTVNLTPTPLSKTFTYDPIGNLLTKSDVGTYSYPAPGSAKPHAVMSVSGGSISTTFTYDANGNQTSGLGRSLVYTSYNKPASITQGTRTISFLDDTDHQRFKQVTPETTTLYIAAFGVIAEVSNPGTASARWTDYLSVGGATVGIRVTQGGVATSSTRYLHQDHLGSVAVITNENGVVQERLSYDAWGKRRFANGTDDTAGSISSQTTRGFTGEEQLSVTGLVHLNGRIYDPILARMTSADPVVSRPSSTQGWNRYAYTSNMPLKRVDSSGYIDCERTETVNLPSCDQVAQWTGELPPVTVDAPTPREPRDSSVTYCVGCSTGSDSGGSNVPGPIVVDLLGSQGGAGNLGIYGDFYISQYATALGYGGGGASAVVTMTPTAQQPASAAAPMPEPRCAIFCSLLGGPVQTSFGTYNHQMLNFGMNLTGFAATGMQAAVPGPEDMLVMAAVGFAGARVAGRLVATEAAPAFKDFNQARNGALRWLEQRGFAAERQTIGKFGDNARKPIGMMTENGKSGFRVEFDQRHGAHINAWSGKEKETFTFEGSQTMVDRIVRQFVKERP